MATALAAIKPQEATLTLYAGSDFTISLTPRDGSYVPVDVKAATVVGCIKASAAGSILAVFNCSVDQTSGAVTAALTKTQTTALQDVPFVVWDLFAIKSSETAKLATGDGVVIPAVFRTTDPAPPDSQAIYEIGETVVPADTFEVPVVFAVEKSGDYWVEVLNVVNLSESGEPIGAIGTKLRIAAGMTVLLTGQAASASTHKVSWAVRVKV